MAVWRNGLRGGVALLLAGVLAIGAAVGVRTARAQGSIQDEIEALALRAHLQDLRTHSYTAWIGGGLGEVLDIPQQNLPGDTLGRWTVTGLDGDPDVSSDTLTRPVLLNFWASWCLPCRLEFPHLAQFAVEAHAFDVVFVNMADTQAAALDFLAQYPPALHITLDPQDRLSSRAQIASIPTSVLLDANGQVLAVQVGMATPTILAFFDAVAAHPGVGSFVAADHMSDALGAELPAISPRTADPIVPDETVTGTLDDALFFHAYRFDGHAGDTVQANLYAISSDLDTYLVLMQADGTRLAENDDIEAGVITDSSLTVTLPQDGTYLVVATRFLEAEGFAPGDYGLTISLSGADDTLTPVSQATPAPDGPQPPAQAGPTTLHYGETASGVLGDSQYEQTWTFEGQQGDVITLVMGRAVDEPGGLDGVLTLIGPDGGVLQEVDDSEGTVMPTLDAYALPADGLYTVVASRFGGAEGLSSGEYTLTLTLAGSTLGTSPAASTGLTGVCWLPDGTLPAGLRRLFYNEEVDGTLDTAHIDDWYLFQGSAGDVITIYMTMTSGDLDPYLILTDLQGYELARDDDGLDSIWQSVIPDFTLPADGSYLIRATRYGFENGPSSGDYALIVETQSAGPELSASALPPVPLSLGELVTGALTLDQTLVRYTFDAQAGEYVTIAAQRADGDLDPALVLRAPDGTEIAVTRGGSDPAEARLERVALPVDGAYTLDVMLEDLTTAGAYRLIALSVPGPGAGGAFEPEADLDLEAVLIWSSAADLDLSVSGPAGEGTPTARANDFCADSLPAPVERVIWSLGQAVPGDYAVSVHYRFNCAGQTEPVQFMLALAANGQVVDLIGGTLAREGDTYTTPLSYAP